MVARRNFPFSCQATLVKAAVTTRQAAEFYGLKVNPHGMTCCPFHHDQHPSMKVDGRYYCFACHETGDVIDFVGKLFKLCPYDAAKKIAKDFGIRPGSPQVAAKVVSIRPADKNSDKKLKAHRVTNERGKPDERAA